MPGSKSKPKTAAAPPKNLAKLQLRAIEAGDARALAPLLAYKGALDLVDDDESISIGARAVLSGNVGVVTAFLDAGSPAHRFDAALGCSLLAAAETPGVARLLLARGAKPDARPTKTAMTPLVAACDSLTEDPANKAWPAIIRELLAAGANPNLTRVDGWTPLMLVAYTGRTDIATWLLDAGAKLDAAKKPDGSRAVDIAADRGHTKLVTLLRKRGARDPVEACTKRLRAMWSDIDRWYAKHAPKCAEELREATGASPAAIAKLEKTLGFSLHYELRALLSLFGGAGRVPWFEYNLLTVERIADRWKGLEKLRKQGVFERDPYELDVKRRQVRFTWWHKGWVPFAEDGGGNLYCVDMDPDANGYAGQVIHWEMQGGPVGPYQPSIEPYVKDYAEKITSGRYVYDERSGTFDEKR